MDAESNKVEAALTYAQTGVDYGAMDPFKKAAQIAGKLTSGNLRRFGYKELEQSRGESAYLIELPDRYIAHVEEGLGTKNLVADAMYDLTGRLFYGVVAQDTVAMIVNDVATSGARVLSVAMHLAIAESSWLDNAKRNDDLLRGWAGACMQAECAFGGGETPTLKGIIVPGTVLLGGSAVGEVIPKSRLITMDGIQDGDQIILLESSGIHANGLTMSREIAEKLPEGYLTKLANGTTYGEALLKPTVIYVRAVQALLDAGIRVHYAVNVTGHGLRKLMRAVRPFVYIIEKLPTQQAIFDFMCEHGPIEAEEAWGNLNMGVGFAVYVHPADVEMAIAILKNLDYRPIHAGHIEAASEKLVVIEPKGLEFKANTLAVR